MKTTILVLLVCLVVLPSLSYSQAEGSVGSSSGSTTHNIEIVGQIDSVTSGASNEVFLHGSYAYVTAFGNSVHDGFVRVVDISVPDAPQLVVSVPMFSRVTGISGTGTYAYVSTATGLAILDLANPAMPQQAGAVLFGEIGHVTVVDQYAYAVASPNLVILDVTDPAAPTQVGAFTFTQGRLTDVAVADGTAFASYDGGCLPHIGCWGGLIVVDVRDPAMPQLLGDYHRKWEAYGLALKGSYAYLAGRFTALDVVDVSDRAHPRRVWVAPEAIDERHMDIVLANSYFYVVGDTGVHVFDPTCPAAPQVVATHPQSGYALAVAGPYLYVGDVDGFLIMRHTGITAQGRIADSHGHPAAGVLVTAVAPGTQRSATSDATGLYSLPQMWAGTSYTLTPALQGYGFLPPTRTVTLGPDTSSLNFAIVAAPVSTTLAPGIATTLSYTDTDGLITQVEVPATAVTQTTSLTLTPTLAARWPGYAFAHHAFDLAVMDNGAPLSLFTFSAPLTVTIEYSVDDVRAVSDTAQLNLWMFTANGWQAAAQSCTPPRPVILDAVHKTVQVRVCQTGRLALFGPTFQVHLPVMARSRCNE